MESRFTPDAELVSACLSGDKASWSALVLRYQGLVLAIGIRMGLSTSDAEDVFQDVCVKLYENLGSLRNAERLSSWLAAITRQEVWRSSRKKKLTLWSDLSTTTDGGAGPLEMEVDPAASPLDTIVAIEDQHLVRLGLARLGEPCRDLLGLLYAEDPPLSYAEISERLSRPVGSLGPMRGRCLEQLRRILAEMGFR